MHLAGSPQAHAGAPSVATNQATTQWTRRLRIVSGLKPYRCALPRAPTDQRAPKQRLQPWMAQ